jgi:hypothetical protein
MTAMIATMRPRDARRRGSTACALGLVLLIESSASAQPASVPAAAPAGTPSPSGTTMPSSPAAPLADSLSGEAKDDYEAGRSLFLHADYTGALVKFQRAFDVSFDTRLLWNIGSCELNLKHYVRVLRLIERYLHEGGSRISDEQRAEAEAMLRKIRPLVSEVRLTVNEPGASVFVDDEPAGTTPLAEPLLLDLGDRRIRVAKSGFQEQVVVEHVVGESDAAVSVTLQPEVRHGGLAVATDASATIFVDGSAVGVGRWDGTLAPGHHALRVTATGMRPYATDLELRDGEQRTLDVALVKDSGGISPWWWVGGGVVAAAGLGAGAYFLFRPTSSPESPTSGTITPYTLTVQRP